MIRLVKTVLKIYSYLSASYSFLYPRPLFVSIFVHNIRFLPYHRYSNRLILHIVAFLFPVFSVPYMISIHHPKIIVSRTIIKRTSF